MSDIGDSMEKKGFMTLVDDGLGALGFKKSINKNEVKLDKKIWFDTGFVMSDGKTPRLVGATDKTTYDEFTAKGYKEFKKRGRPAKPKKTAVKKAVK